MEQNSFADSIKVFMNKKLDIKDYCFILSHYLNEIKLQKGDKYKYDEFCHQTKRHQCIEIVNTALSYGEIDYIVFYIIKWWLERESGDEAVLHKYDFYKGVCFTDEYLQLKGNLEKMKPDPIGIRISNFLCNVLCKNSELKEFCLNIPVYLKEIKQGLEYRYAYINNIINEAEINCKYICHDFVNSAEAHEAVYHLVFFIVKYWFETKIAESSVLHKYFFHEDLCCFYEELVKQKDQKMAEEVEKLIEKFTIGVNRCIKVFVSEPVFKKKEFDVYLCIMPPDALPISNSIPCSVSLNAQVKDGSIIWQSKVKAKLKTNIPKYCFIPYTRKDEILVQEPHDEVEWIAFKLTASAAGSVKLRFIIYQGKKKIAVLDKVIEIKDFDYESVIGQIFLLFLLSQRSFYYIINESRQKQLELLERITKKEKEKEKLQEVITYLEETLEDYVVRVAGEGETEQIRGDLLYLEQKQEKMLGVFESEQTSILKGLLSYTWSGFFTFFGVGIYYQYFILSYKSKIPILLEKAKARFTKPRQIRFIRESSESAGGIIGIDLGTTYSSIAVPKKLKGKHVYIGNDITILKDDNNQYLIPSVAATDEKGAEYVGQPAKDKIDHKPAPITFAKRFIGEDIELPFGNGGLLPEEVTARILSYLKKIAEDWKIKVEMAVISVPRHFKENQRQKTKKAGELAGFKMIEFIEDPIAAALMYEQSYKYHPKKSNIIMTYDLGGGTFEATILTKEKDSLFKIDKPDFVYCAPHINGENIDKRLADWIVDQLKININPDSIEMKKLLALAETVKISLMKKLPTNTPKNRKKQKMTSISFLINLETFEGSIEYNTKNSHKMFEEPGKPISLTIDLETFEGLIEKDIDETIEHCRELQNKAPKEIDDILLIGGNTYIPLVSRKLKEAFNIEPKLKSPELCVAAGAAIMANNRIKANSDLTN
jgi:actin-like ATPase involved in cell morphogenesis